MGMINLLPVETKKELRAARTNTVLIRYLIFIGFSIAFLTLASIVSYWFLTGIEDNNKKAVSDQKTVQTAYESAQKQLDVMTNDIAIASNIIDQQTNFSSIITDLAATIPSGVVIDSLKLNNSDIGKPITISGKAISEDAVNTLRNNLSGSQNYSSPSVQSVSDSRDSNYPITITINITINRKVSS